MTLEEAKETMYEGGAVTHETFEPDEYISMDDFGETRTNDGYRYPLCELAEDDQYSYINDGWSNWSR